MNLISLPDFISFLSEQTAKSFKGDAVDDFLHKHYFSEDAFLPFIYFREETYGRNLVFKSDLFELLILTWLPQQRTPIHDHNGQRCWMVLQTGTLTFKNFKTPETDTSPLEVVGPCETHSAHEPVYIDDGIGVHSIANATSKPAVSMHLYAAPIPRCRIYDECAKKFKTVELQYFTSPEIHAPESTLSL